MTDLYRSRTDTLAPEGANRLGTVVGPDRAWVPGDIVPLLWHWAYFPDLAGRADLGADGHPRRSDPWAQDYPRRMWGGGNVRRSAEHPFVLGQATERRAVPARDRERLGRVGPLVISERSYSYFQNSRLVLEEAQLLIFLPEQHVPAHLAEERPRTGPEDGEDWSLVAEVSFDAVTLYRYSAATWNSHRIHYDLRYAVENEHYPGLVVHGPLLATVLAREIEAASGPVMDFSYRSSAPLFQDETVLLYLQENGAAWRGEARKPDGSTVMTVRAGDRLALQRAHSQ